MRCTFLKSQLINNSEHNNRFLNIRKTRMLIFDQYVRHLAVHASLYKLKILFYNFYR